MKKSRYNLNAQEKLNRELRKAELIQEKEKVFLETEWQGYCDNSDHPLFSVKVTYNKPWATCYYCSKMWILEKDKTK